jgi:amino acid permease
MSMNDCQQNETILSNDISNTTIFDNENILEDDKIVSELEPLPIINQTRTKLISHTNTFAESVNFSRPRFTLVNADYVCDDWSEDSSRRTIFEKWFSPIRAGSLRGSIVSLASFSFDTTFLSFPYAVSKVGLIPGLIILFTVIIISYLTLRLLLITGRKKRVFNYRELINTCYGKKMVTFSDINNFIFCFGTEIAYVVTISKFSLELLEYFFTLDKVNEYLKLTQMLVCMLLFQVPISMLKNMSNLQYASLLGFVVVIYTVIVVFIQSFYYYQMGKSEGREIVYFKPINWEALETVGIFLYCYAPHNGLFLVYEELKRPTQRRSLKVLNRAIFAQSFVFIIMTIAGFLSLINDVPGIFISRAPNEIFDPNDYLILISKVLFIFSIHCICAINYNMFRGTLSAILFNGKDSTLWQNFYSTFIFYLFANLFAFLFDEVVYVIGIISGLSVTFLCYVFPVLCYIKSNDYPISNYRNIICIFIMVFISIIGFMCSIKATIDNFKSNK